MCCATVLCDFWVSVFSESAGGDEIHLWQDEEEGEDAGCSVYHWLLVFCGLRCLDGGVAGGVEVYEQFGYTVIPTAIWVYTLFYIL